MCGIVGSPTLSDGSRMATSVKSRGTRAWSLSLIDLNTFTMKHIHCDSAIYDEQLVGDAVREWAYMDTDNIDPYYIFHLQSPTAVDHKFHPAVFMGPDSTEHYLWHNGMMDSSEHRKYSRTWDTQILLESFIDESGDPDFNRLSEFQGSFACYYLNSGKGLYAFRNSISPQYGLSGAYSSMPFDGASKLEPGVVYSIPTHEHVAAFDNSYNPFGV